MSDRLPRIYVFCNTQDCHGGNWHSMCAIAEDGTPLAGHVCSNHGFANHDMGISPDGWKRDLYAAHYPNGFEVRGVEDFNDPELQAALAKAPVSEETAP